MMDHIKNSGFLAVASLRERRLATLLFLAILFFLQSPANVAAGDSPFGNGCYLGAYLGCGVEDSSCPTIEAFNYMTGKRHSIFIRYSEKQKTFKNIWIDQVYDVGTLKNSFPMLQAICWFHVLKNETIYTRNCGFAVEADYRIPDDHYNVKISDNYFISAHYIRVILMKTGT